MKVVNSIFGPEATFWTKEIPSSNALYFALYWFEKVSAEKHVDVIYAASEVMEVVLGFGIDSVPMVFQDFMDWFMDNSGKNDVRNKRSSGFMENMMSTQVLIRCFRKTILYISRKKLHKLKKTCSTRWRNHFFGPRAIILSFMRFKPF